MIPTATAEANPIPERAVSPARAPAAPAGARVPEIVRRRLAPFDARLDPYSWIAAAVVTVIAAIVRLVNLSHPPGKIFDELYYAAEAQALLRHGVEWDLENNTAKYVVHPPLGKWMIALGQWLTGLARGGPDPATAGYDEFGWRISAAVVGILTVLMITRIARRMFGSTVLGCAAGLLMALDGMHFVLSRVALLDIFLMFFVLAAFGALVLDRDARRRRWLRHIEAGADPSRPGPAGRPGFSWGAGVPWWRLAAGVFLGCAIGVKWSAAFFVPVLLLLAFWWEVGARRSAGVRRPWRDTLLDETGWFALGGLLILLTYLATWTGWFLTDNGYHRHRAGVAETPVIGALLNLWGYHMDALGFHNQLAQTHPYQSEPWQWLLLGRPVAFYWTSDGPCGAPSCAGEVLLLGTPILWWSFILAIPLMVWFGIARRDWRVPAIGLGIMAGILPWFYYAYQNRTMFYFYALPAEPFLVLAVVYVLGAFMRPPPGTPRSAAVDDRRTIGAIVAGGYVLAVALCFAYFYPVYAGHILPYAEWWSRMWLAQRWV